MSILIKNMEMPKENDYTIAIVYGDGVVTEYHEDYWIRGTDGEKQLGTAVPVPPHGRLIDADALTEKLKKHREYHLDGSSSGAAISNGIGQCLDIINGKECPTIIPAEEGE